MPKRVWPVAAIIFPNENIRMKIIILILVNIGFDMNVGAFVLVEQGKGVILVQITSPRNGYDHLIAC
jgi:hypothetical protein